jgi:hypothetical protein
MKNIAVMGFMESGVAEYFRSLFNRLFLTVIVAGFLNAWGGTTGVTELFNAIFAPIFYLGLSFANEFLAAALPGGGGVNVLNYFGTDPLCTFVMGGMKDNAGNAVSLTFTDKIISDDLINATVCIIGQIGAFLKTGLLASWVLLNFAFADAPFGIFFVPIAAVLGLFIFGYPYLSMMVYVPMYLIDALTRVMLVGALLPLFAVSYVFPSTRNFSLKALNIVITSALTFMFIGMFVGISIEFLITIYEKLLPWLSLNAGDDMIDHLLDFNEQEIVVIIVMPFILMSMLGKATKFAQYFGNLPFVGIDFVSGSSQVAQVAVATTIQHTMNTYHKASDFATRSRNARNSGQGPSPRAALNSFNPDDGPQPVDVLVVNTPIGPAPLPPRGGGDSAASDNAPDNASSVIDSKFHDVLGMGGGNAQSSGEVADSAWENYQKGQEQPKGDDKGSKGE